MKTSQDGSHQVSSLRSFSQVSFAHQECTNEARDSAMHSWLVDGIPLPTEPCVSTPSCEPRSDMPPSGVLANLQRFVAAPLATLQNRPPVPRPSARQIASAPLQPISRISRAAAQNRQTAVTTAGYGASQPSKVELPAAPAMKTSLFSPIARRPELADEIADASPDDLLTKASMFRLSFLSNRSAVVRSNDDLALVDDDEDEQDPAFSTIPFLPGQRLEVLHFSKMREHEDVRDPNNQVLCKLEAGELVYFIKTGVNGRVKIQRAMDHSVGWVSWEHAETGIRILAIRARDV
eukprot:GEMP01023571.1.p1 GENE.GEMP01023571.1~~GEMP01023571.1.p1  ORF type:complete len:292 (+),score=60.33 GEMP01023571.1:245-1120(+)